MLFIGLSVLLIFDFWYALQVYSQQSETTFLFLFVIIAFFLVSTFLYYCPVLSRFQMKQWNALKFSLGLAARHMGYTVLMVLLWLAFGVLGFFTRGLTLFVLLSAGVLVQSLMMEKILKKYVLKTLEQQAAKEDEKNESENKSADDSNGEQELSFNFKQLDETEAKYTTSNKKGKKKITTSEDEWYLE